MSDKQAASPRSDGFLRRLDDRLNPILVREINQSLGGRAFPGMLHASVAAIIVICVIFSQIGYESGQTGRLLMTGCIACIAPLVLGFVPMAAFASTRHEVNGGTAEQLLMTRLRPLRIVSGKLSASLLHFVIFLSVFAPVIAITYLLNGVDMAMVVLLLFMAMMLAIAATSFAVAMGTLGGTKHFQQLVQGVTSTALFGFAFWAMAGSGFVPELLAGWLRDGEFWASMGAVVAAVAAFTLLCCIIAATSLAHAYENRSTPFRVFAVGVQVLAIPWMLLVLRTPDLDDIPAYLSMGIAGFGLPFWLWANCEDRALSPRVRTLVPRRAWLARLSVPFLPGGDRGFVLTLLMAVIGATTPWITAWLGGVSVRSNPARACALTWCYVVTYAGIARFVRLRMGSARGRSLLTMVIVALGSGLFWVGVIFFYILTVGRPQWHLLHLPDPFMTLDKMWSLTSSVTPVIVMTLACGLLGVLISVRRAFAEIAQASAQRRKLASGS